MFCIGLYDGNQKLKMEMGQSAAILESFRSANESEDQYEFCSLEARCFVFVFVFVFLFVLVFVLVFVPT